MEPLNESRGSRRWRGRVLALAMMAGLGGAAWYLTHRPPAASSPGAAGSAAEPGKRRASGAGAGGGGGGRGGPVSVGVAVAQKGSIPVYLEALGTVTSSATVVVKAQVSGMLKQVLYQEGQLVKVGQPLALIDPRPFEMALMQASGQRLRDEAQLDLARLTLQRDQNLLKQDAISQQDVQTQAAQVKQLEGSVMADKASEGTARLNLSYTRVVAPASGRVGLRPVDAGNVVSTSDANGVAVITQTSPINVQFSLPQDQIQEVQARLAQGDKVPALALDRARIESLDQGSFLTIDNLVDAQTGTVKAKARFPNGSGRLFPNQFVNVRVLLKQAKDAVTVPVAAVRTGPDGDYVYVLNEDKTVSLRKVTRGPATAESVAVATGLELGEKVVTEGADRLRDGTRVNLAGSRQADGAASQPGQRRRREGRGPDQAGSAAGPGGSRPEGAASGGWAHRRRASDAAGQEQQ